jgi:hypothetical protein
VVTLPSEPEHDYDFIVRIGVLAVQGNVREHAAMLRGLGAETNVGT